MWEGRKRELKSKEVREESEERERVKECESILLFVKCKDINPSNPHAVTGATMVSCYLSNITFLFSSPSFF